MEQYKMNSMTFLVHNDTALAIGSGLQISMRYEHVKNNRKSVEKLPLEDNCILLKSDQRIYANLLESLGI